MSSKPTVMKVPKLNSGLGPRKRQPNKPEGSQIGLNFVEYQISFDAAAFDNFIRSQGVKLIHYRAIPDPTGMINRGDTHAVDATRRSSDGFVYKKAGECYSLFSSNSQNFNIEVEGTISAASAYLTLPRTYSCNGEPILIHPWDRFYIKDIEVRVINFQYMETSRSGLDRLQYPATCVEHLVDADGIQYEPGVDFEINSDGNIVWTGQKRPGYDPQRGKGKIYAIRYRYVPFFVAVQLIHEIRVAQVSDPNDFNRYLERLPYNIHVVREHVFQDTNRDPDVPVIDQRLQTAPAPSGNLGPKQ